MQFFPEIAITSSCTSEQRATRKTRGSFIWPQQFMQVVVSCHGLHVGMAIQVIPYCTHADEKANLGADRMPPSMIEGGLVKSYYSMLINLSYCRSHVWLNCYYCELPERIAVINMSQSTWRPNNKLKDARRQRFLSGSKKERRSEYDA